METHQPEIIQQQPGVIQIFLDGVEIFSTEDGNDECSKNLADTSQQPEVLEMTWNGMVVYSMKLPSSVDRSKLKPDFLVRCFSKFLEEHYPSTETLF